MLCLEVVEQILESDTACVSVRFDYRCDARSEESCSSCTSSHRECVSDTVTAGPCKSHGAQKEK